MPGFLFSFAAAVSVFAASQEAVSPPELGRVRWQRDYEQGLAAAAKTERPLFLLFQEIPGCATCVNFGNSPLSHPLLVEAIEELFVPVAIHNNRGGKDAATLEIFGEPSWNNPVVRFVGADGKDLIPRKDRVWDTHGVASRMIQALESAKRQVPEYLRLVAEETAPIALEKAIFSMPCFWHGEAVIGSIPGVFRTRAGFVNGTEVVEVHFDSRRLPYEKLIEKAKSRDDSLRAIDPKGGLFSPAPDGDQKYHLRRSPYSKLDLTPLQVLRVNAALGAGQEPENWLSPRQIAKKDKKTKSSDQ